MAEPISTELQFDRAGRLPWSARAWSLLVLCLGLALSTLTGCRNLDNAQTDVLERELRQQEDYIYELEDYLIEYSEKLRQARMAECDPAVTSKSTTAGAGSGEPTLDEDTPRRPTLPLNGRHKMQLPAPKGAAPPATTTAPAADAAATEAPPAETAPEPAPAAEPEAEPIDPAEMEAPELEIGPGVQSQPWKNSRELAESPATPTDQTNDAPPLLIPDPVDYQADQEEPAAQDDLAVAETMADEAAEPHVIGEPILAAPAVNGPRLSADHLQIRRIFGEPAVENAAAIGSLLVVVEALNATQEPVGAEGEASLMIMARDESGALSRVDRWDFTAEETAAAWQSSSLGDGLHLELPLAKQALPSGDLELWARVVNAEGQKLLTQIPFDPTELTSMAEGADETMLASTEEPPAEPATIETTPATTTAPAAAKPSVAETTPAAQWRPSTVKLDPNRVEGFATTAGGQGNGWTSRPAGVQEPRVASATSGNVDRPTWQRSTTAAAAKDSSSEWMPFR